MMLGKVVGTVVSSSRADGIANARYLLVEASDERGKRLGGTLVALDLVQANTDQLVMLAQGSSCRWTPETTDKPIDALIVGIVDSIDVASAVTYNAGGEEESEP